MVDEKWYPEFRELVRSLSAYHYGDLDMFTINPNFKLKDMLPLLKPLCRYDQYTP
jgi:hypothetical protein